MSLQQYLTLVAVSVSFAALLFAPSERKGITFAVFLCSLPLYMRFLQVTRIYPTLEMIAVLILMVKYHKPSYYPHISRSCLLPVATYLAVTIFWTSAFLSSMFSTAPEIGVKVLLSGGLIPFIIYGCIMRTKLSKLDISWMCIGMVVLGVTAALAVILSYVYYDKLGYVDDFSASGLAKLYEKSNPAVLFEVPSVTGALIAMALPFSALLFTWQTIWEKMLGFTGFILMSVAMFLTLKRGTWLAFVVILPFCLQIGCSGKTKRLVGIGIVVAIVFSVMFVASGLGLLPDVLHSRGMMKDGLSNGTGTRLENFIIAATSAVRFPVLGLGLGQYSQVYALFPEADASSGHELWFAHNLFLTLVPEIGLLGAVSYLFIHLRFLFLARSGFVSEVHRPVLRACFTAVLAFLVHATVTGLYLISALGNIETTSFYCPVLTVLFLIYALIEQIRHNDVRERGFGQSIGITIPER